MELVIGEAEFRLRHPNGKSLPVTVRGAARRDTLIGRGYALVTRGFDYPQPQPEQKRRQQEELHGSQES